MLVLQLLRRLVMTTGTHTHTRIYTLTTLVLVLALALTCIGPCLLLKESASVVFGHNGCSTGIVVAVLLVPVLMVTVGLLLLLLLLILLAVVILGLHLLVQVLHHGLLHQASRK